MKQIVNLEGLGTDGEDTVEGDLKVKGWDGMDWMNVMHEILGSTDYRQLLVC